MANPNRTSRVGVLVATFLLASVLVTAGAPPVNAEEAVAVNTTLVGYDHVVVEWTTTTPSVSAVVYGPTTEYGLLWFDTNPDTSHRVDLAGLSCESTYHLNVISIDAENQVTSSGDIEVRTGTCPTNNAGVAPVQVVANARSAVISWGSVIAGQGAVRYGSSRQYGNTTTEDPGSSRFHNVELSGLDCDANYLFEGVTEGTAGSIESTGSFSFRTYACDPFVDNVAIDSGSTTATLTWTTDAISTGTVIIGESTSYGQELNTGQQADVHRVDIADLNCGTTYHYRIIAADDLGDAFWTPDATMRTGACTAADAAGGSQTSQAPEIDNVVTAAGETSLLISWVTNEVSSATATYRLSRDEGGQVNPPIEPEVITVSGPNVGVAHEIVITGLTCDGSYTVTARSTDGSGLTSISEPIAADTLSCGSGTEVALASPSPIQPPLDPPAELSVSDVSVRDITRRTAAVLWSTTAPASGSVVFGETAEFGSEARSAVAGLTQRIVLVGLRCGTTYSYSPVALARNGMMVVSGAVGNFMTMPCTPTPIIDVEPDPPPPVEPPPVVEPPVVEPPLVEPPDIALPPIDEPPLGPPIGGPPGDDRPNVGGPVVDPPVALTDIEVDTTNSTALISWLTDQAASSSLKYGKTTAYGFEQADQALRVQHLANLTGLECATTYHFRITASPANGDLVGTGDRLFTTDSCPAEPFAIANRQVETSMFSATISWTTTQDAAGRVDFGSNGDLSTAVENAEILPAQSFVLAGLDCGTLYSYRVEASRPDAFANSGVLTFATAACAAV